MQVELAQLQHLATRLTRLWTHLERQRGGIGMRGPGESQLEMDRRMIGAKVKVLRERLDKVERQRVTQRRARARGGALSVSLVGYTNAGKSTLFNALTRADTYAADQLFATLDTTTRRIWIEGAGSVVVSDTVGFIRDLPHHLVASFKATLEEARQARLLLHVVDAGNPLAEEHIRAVNEVLKDLDCADKPTILVLNKIDTVADRSALAALQGHHPHAVAISGLTGEGLDDLRAAVVSSLSKDFLTIEVTGSVSNGKLIAYLNAHAEIFRQEFRGNEVVVRCHLPKALHHHVAAMGGVIRPLAAEVEAKAG